MGGGGAYKGNKNWLFDCFYSIFLTQKRSKRVIFDVFEEMWER